MGPPHDDAGSLAILGDAGPAIWPVGSNQPLETFDAAADATALAVDADRGTLWVVGLDSVSNHGADGMELFRSDLDVPEDAEAPGDDDPRHVVVVPEDGSVWISAGPHLWTVDTDGETFYRGEREAGVVGLAVDGDAGVLWLADGESVEAFDLGAGDPLADSVVSLELPDEFPEATPENPEPDPIGTAEPTALLFEPGTWDGDTQTAAARVWVGAGTRLLRYVLPLADDDTADEAEDTAPPLDLDLEMPEDVPVSEIVPDGDDGVWFLGGSQLGRWRARSERLSFQPPFRPQETELTAMAYDPGNRAVWVAGGDRLVRVGLSGWALGRRHKLSEPVFDLAVISAVDDDIPPELEITRPRNNEEQDAGRPELRFAYSDETSGIDEGSLELQLDGEPLDARCFYRQDSATCRPLGSLDEGEYELTATVEDVMGNRSEVATARLTLILPPGGGGGGGEGGGGEGGDPTSPQYSPVASPRGFQPDRPFNFGEIDTIDTSSGNLTLRVPLGQVFEVGPMIRYQIQAVNNSNVWDHIRTGCPKSGCQKPHEPVTFSMTNPASNAGLGWEIHFGKLYSPDPPEALWDSEEDWQRWPNRGESVRDQNERWIYVAPDGARHDLLALEGRDLGNPARPIRYSGDGSYLRMQRQSDSEVQLEFPDGRVSVFRKTGELAGTDFCGNGVTGCWRFAETRDPYGNRMWVEYEEFGGREFWTIHDSTGRSHRIAFSRQPADVYANDGHRAPAEFRTVEGAEWGDLRRVATSVQVAAFGGRTATYRFFYEKETFRRGPPHEGEKMTDGYDTLDAPVLKTITVPESQPYRFVTASGRKSPHQKVGGRVIEVTLPTRGRLAYDYGIFWRQPTRCDYQSNEPAETFTSVPGIERKERKTPGGLAEAAWNYDAKLVPAPRTLVSSGADCTRSRYRVTTVLGPSNADGRRVKTEHYHSVHQGGPGPHVDQTDGDDWQITDHGLPYTKDHWVSGLDDRLFLSQRTWLCRGTFCGSPLRSVFRRYASEFRSCGQLPGKGDGDDPGCFRVNGFQVAERVIYHDDGHRYVERRSRHPDGAGHLRTRLVDDNLQGNHRRSTTTSYTVTGKTLAIDADSGYVDVGDPSSYLPDPDDPWILTPFNKTTVTENGRTYVEETHFNSQGSPICRRAWKNGGSRSRQDRVVRLDLGGRVGVNAGLPITERVSGGDYGRVGTGGICTIDTSSSQGRLYVFEHTYRDLQLAGTRIAGFPFRYRADVDENTGLPSRIYEPTDQGRTLDFDLLGRLTKIDPDPSLREAETVYQYRNPSTADPSMTMRRKAFFGSDLLSETTIFDHFGRPKSEKRTVPNPNSVSGFHTSEVQTAYDGAGHVIRQTTRQREGQVRTSDARHFSQFDAFGRPGRIVEADGSVETRDHTGDRRTVSTVRVQTPNGLQNRSVTTLHDAQGRTISTQTSEHTTTFTYDPHGRQVSARRQVGNVAQTRTWGRDGRGYLTSVGLPEVTGNGGAITYRVDALGLAREVRDGAHVLTWNYNGDGRPTSVTEGSRTWKTWSYAANNAGSNYQKGKLIRAERYNHFPVRETLMIREDYEYRGGSAGISRLDRTLVLPDRGPNVEDVKFRMHLSYDLLGNQTSLTYPYCVGLRRCNDGNDDAASGHTVTWSYNQGMMRQVRSSLGPEADFNYYANLQLSEVKYSNGVTGTYLRDPDSLVRPYRRTFTGPEGTLFDTGYFDYDGAGNIRTIGVERYTYDGAGRLRRGTVNQAEPGRWEEYRYDAADNLVNVRNDSFGGEGIPADRPFTVDPRTNRILRVGPEETFVYDGAGNTLEALRVPGEPDPDDPDLPHYEWTWDVFNMQTQVKRNLEGGGSELWVYVYGPGDYRLWTEDYTGDELVIDWKFRGPDGQILQEYEVLDVGATWNHVRDVIHGAEGPMAARYADGSERYFHTDHLGTPRVITKADGTKLSEHHYYPYGLEVPIEVESPVPEDFIFADGFESGDTSRWATQDHPQPPPERPSPEELSVKYTGHERDLHRSTDYMLARSYAFLLGRFLSVDPVQDGWNRYGYARNNPVGFTDPTGLYAGASNEELADAHNAMTPEQQEQFAEAQTTALMVTGGVALAFTPGPEDAVIAVAGAKFAARAAGKVGSFFRKLFRGADNVTDAGSAASRVPGKATETLDYVRQTGRAPDGYKGGRKFQNREGKLPEDGQYKEYDVDPKPPGGEQRNAERIVVDQDSGRAWYTKDHYETFVEVK